MKLYEVTYSNNFLRSLKKLQKSGSFESEKLLGIVNLIASGEILPINIKDHALKANWAGYRECHITPNLLLIYKIEGNILALSYIGSHSELFG